MISVNHFQSQYCALPSMLYVLSCNVLFVFYIWLFLCGPLLLNVDIKV